MNKSAKATLGSKVIVENKREGKLSFVLVLPDQADLTENKISIGSPVGEALLNRQTGDSVVVKIPAGDKQLKIISVN